MYNCYHDIPSCVVSMYYSSNGQLLCVDKVEKSNRPKLFNDAIEEWPNYMNIPLDKKRYFTTTL